MTNGDRLRQHSKENVEVSIEVSQLSPDKVGGCISVGRHQKAADCESGLSTAAILGGHDCAIATSKRSVASLLAVKILLQAIWSRQAKKEKSKPEKSFLWRIDSAVSWKNS